MREGVLHLPMSPRMEGNLTIAPAFTPPNEHPALVMLSKLVAITTLAVSYACAQDTSSVVQAFDAANIVPDGEYGQT